MLRIISTCLLLISLVAHARADERMGSFAVYDDIQDAIVLDGDIGINSPLDFRRALAARPHAKMLILNSAGGIVASALLIADDVNRNGLSTAIPKDAGCYSACSFIFFAGSSRYAEGKLGVHQMASDSPDPAGVQTTMSDILEALNRYHVPLDVITRMLRTPAEDMYVFSPDEIVSLGIETYPSGPSRSAATKRQEVEPPTPQESEPTLQPRSRLAIYGGTDFYGRDVSKSRVGELADCAKSCANQGQCVAFTFNANPTVTAGPNCFLKDGIGNVQAYSQALSGLFLSPNMVNPSWDIDVIDPLSDVSQETLIPNQNLPGSPVPGVQTQNQCLQACLATNECAGFSYAYEVRLCFLKGTAIGLVHQSLVNSGIKRHMSIAPLSVIDLDEPAGSSR